MAAPFGLFEQPTSGNSCEVLIDGIQTFQRMFESLNQAQSSISILAWQINLDFGMVPTNSASPFMLAAIGVDPGATSLLTLEDVLVWKVSRALRSGG